MQKKTWLFNQFKGYPSIQICTNIKSIKNIQQSNFDEAHILWIATQKIHGSNFSIAYDFQKDLVRYGRRNDYISNQIPVPVQNVQPFFTQNFFDAHELVNTFHNDLTKIKENILRKYKKVMGIQIYGQFFGGFWPQNKECKKRVQLGVYYTPNHQFMVFDIKLIGQQFHSWIQVAQIADILEGYIKYIPIYTQGTLEQILKVNSQIDSTIPKLLGLEHLENNISQGLVIRPNRNIFAKNRVILKKKNKQFLEKTGFTKQQKNIKQPENNQSKQYISQLQNYLNENRIESAISKHPDFEDHFHLKGYVIEDILEDAKKQGYQQPQIQKIQKQVHKGLDKMVLQYVVDYLKNERKQFAQKIKN